MQIILDHAGWAAMVGGRFVVEERFVVTIESVKCEREVAERNAESAASQLPDGDYYADGKDCVDRMSGNRWACATHWKACLLMMAANRRSDKV